MGDAWIGAVTRSGGVAGKAAASADDLLVRYGEPHRSYHTEQHIRAMLVDVAQLAEKLDPGGADRDVLILATCAHDVVYNGQPGDDEQASAEWARTHLLDASVPEHVVAQVEALVLATITHESDGDLMADVLLDADLAILGAAEERYDEYAQAVRAEYAHVSDERWRVGRANVLRGLLDRDVLYRTEEARQRWDAAARANLQRELTALQGEQP